MKLKMRCFVGPVLLIGLILIPFLSRAQYTNGIYAEFSTSMGSFTCRLEYVLAPKACANFIGLATGTQAWLDETTGAVRTNPLYNGVIFHRVISNFMNQAGSPTGIGNGGPGYAFVDEFTPALRHDSFGVLSMANSGPDSNGSQFFITVSPQPALNDVHTVFGKIYGGSNVVFNINRVATDANDRPLANVTINSIAIRRIGTAANAFNVAANGLPLVTNLNTKIARSGTGVSLTFSNRLYADNRVFASTNLLNWSNGKVGIETANPIFTNVVFGTPQPKQFFRMAQVQYPSSTFAPKSVLNKTIAFTFTNGLSDILTVNLNNSGGGTCTWPPDTGSVTGYDWLQNPYRGFLHSLSTTFFWPMDFNLNFKSSTNGYFSGQFYWLNAIPIAMSGTFTNSL